jgi:catechol 2,3-dioxygenase-like lactoylglutathione lyase family enzyme
MDLLGPLGLRELERYPTYRGTEQVVYLSFGDESLGLRRADGGGHRYYDVELEHLAFEVDTSEEVEAAHERCLRRGDRIHCPPEEDSDISGYYAFFFQIHRPDLGEHLVGSSYRSEIFCTTEQRQVAESTIADLDAAAAASDDQRAERPAVHPWP